MAACVVIIVAFITANVIGREQSKSRDVFISNNKVVAELAVTGEQLAQGLSGRDKLAEGRGMLFIYDGYYIPSFWMKNMKFPIDIIWIKDNIVAGAAKNLPPEGEQPQQTYEPLTFVNYVLEVPAGYVDRYGIKIGDRVEIK
jgi:hypothetical protein